MTFSSILVVAEDTMTPYFLMAAWYGIVYITYWYSFYILAFLKNKKKKIWDYMVSGVLSSSGSLVVKVMGSAVRYRGWNPVSFIC